MEDNIDILFEDKDLLIINKPSGITVNDSETTKDKITIQSWNKQFINLGNNSDIPNEIFDEFKNRDGVVHRLDKETSGALILAKNAKSFWELKKQFMERTIKKTYLALAHGEIKPEIGEISAPVGRESFNRMRFGVVIGGREAITLYKIISKFQFPNFKKNEKLSLVELNPKTGRTHQIRVHLKHIGHPIFADELYAGRKTARDDRKFLNRFFLHAEKIEFKHPVTEKFMSITAPLSKELKDFLETLTTVN